MHDGREKRGKMKYTLYNSASSFQKRGFGKKRPSFSFSPFSPFYDRMDSSPFFFGAGGKRGGKGHVNRKTVFWFHMG